MSFEKKTKNKPLSSSMNFRIFKTQKMPIVFRVLCETLRKQQTILFSFFQEVQGICCCNYSMIKRCLFICSGIKLHLIALLQKIMNLIFKKQQSKNGKINYPQMHLEGS